VPWRLDHVQLAVPEGSEARCDAFYVTLMGFTMLEKPPELALRGGRWYQRGEVLLHLGVQREFRAATKVHPALVVDDYDALLARLRRAGVVVRDDDALVGTTRCYVDDPVGNRIELIDASTTS